MTGDRIDTDGYRAKAKGWGMAFRPSQAVVALCDEVDDLYAKVDDLTAVLTQVRPVAADPAAPATAVRAGAGSTERAAALRSRPRSGTQRAALLEWASNLDKRRSGFTDDEAARALGRNPARLASRRKELLDGGWVAPVPADDTDPWAHGEVGTYEGREVRTRLTRQGTPAVVWRVTPRRLVDVLADAD